MQSKKGMQREMATVSFIGKSTSMQIQILKTQADWLLRTFEKISIDQPGILTLQELMESYEKAGLEDFELFWDNKPMNGLWKMGLLRM
jgi:hypothetical protein